MIDGPTEVLWNLTATKHQNINFYVQEANKRELEKGIWNLEKGIWGPWARNFVHRSKSR
jgi:hypothetical protein